MKKAIKKFEGRLLTAKEVSERYHWSTQTVFNKVNKRQIPFIKIGRSVRFLESDLALLEIKSAIVK